MWHVSYPVIMSLLSDTVTTLYNLDKKQSTSTQPQSSGNSNIQKFSSFDDFIGGMMTLQKTM